MDNNKIKTKKRCQTIFHMFPQSLMKNFFDDKSGYKGFISYDFKKQIFNKKQLSINSINSINLKGEIFPKNMQIFEKKLNIIESKYSPFLNELVNCSKKFDWADTSCKQFNTKIGISGQTKYDVLKKKWNYDQNKNILNLPQFFYYLTIQAKYYNTFFIDNIINEKIIEKLMMFLDLEINNENLFTNEEKQWFSYLRNLKDFIYEDTFAIVSNENILNFPFNTLFLSAFTSNPISITKLDKNMISFVIPISFSKTIIIFFTKKIWNLKGKMIFFF